MLHEGTIRKSNNQSGGLLGLHFRPLGEFASKRKACQFGSTLEGRSFTTPKVFAGTEAPAREGLARSKEAAATLELGATSMTT
jgi:hypothetical protein